MKREIRNGLLLTLLLLMLVLPQAAAAAVLNPPMETYCITPPFITAGIQPNLLLMLDNSASMFDLTYADKGCSTCSPARKPKYCYDNTFSDAGSKTYAGYFENDSYYNYDIPNGRFVKTTGFPVAADCTYYHSNKFCVKIDAATPPRVTRFSAVGNYLNWLTASKFDVQKKILTGGKWNSAELIGESRGCVGRGFIKQPLSSNNGNYLEGGTNTAFPLSLQIVGTSTSNDATSPSQGGQTLINFYKSATAVDFAKCDEAINLLETTNSISNAVKTAVADCIGANETASLAGKAQQIFGQSLQECWQYQRSSAPKTVGNDALTVKKFCTDVFNLRDPSHVSTNPAKDISAGDAALLCSDNYVGACYAGGVASLQPAGMNLFALLSPNAAYAATPGTVQFKSSSYSVNENGGSVNLEVSRTGGSDGKVNITYKTANGSAVSPGDYTAKTGTITFNNNNATDQTITIIINDDALLEGAETFTVTLTSTEIVIGSTPTTTITINDNETAGGPGVINFETAAPPNVNEAAGSIVLNVLRTGGSTGAASVNYATANGTATAPGDYTTKTGTLNWADGDTANKTITIAIISDAVAEVNQSFTVTLSGATGAALGTIPTTTVTITEAVVAAGAWPDTWSSDACVIQQHNLYCGGLSLPEVIDPTNVELDTTTNYSNLPAVIADVALIGQMGAPIKLLSGGVEYPDAKVKVSTTETDGTLVTPEGLIQLFGSKIRVGLMSFNYNGSASECAANSSIPCPNVCSNDAVKSCSTALDCCVAGGGCTCNPTTSTTNSDGAKILYDVGLGTCSHDSSVKCTTNANCTPFAASSICTMTGAGSHSSGLVYQIDDLRASSWTPFSEAFYDAIGYYAYTGPTLSRTALRINSADFPDNRNPSQFVCQQNYLLLISDGVSTADQRPGVMALADTYKAGAALSGGACPSYKGSSNLPILSWLARNKKISDFSTTDAALSSPAVLQRDKIYTYVVDNGQDTGSGECSSAAMMLSTATKGGGKYYKAENPEELTDKLRLVFEEISAKAASGTAASILSNSEGSGANILQAVFYPKKIFDNATEVNWVGEMQNLWYFVDPYINNSTIREDSGISDYKLHLVTDYVARFAFDTNSDKTMVQLYQDSDGNGSADTAVGGLIDPDNVKSLWRAGKLLWARNISTSPRNIKTSLNGSSLIDFSSATSATLTPYLNTADATEAANLINWVHGEDVSPYRSRKVEIKPSASATPPYPSGIWKLGDIISSTPRVQSTVRLNTYSLPYPGGYNDKSYESYTNSNDYKNRGMVYVGGNDGLFHAFYLGILSVKSSGFEKASLSDPGGIGLGKEIWSYIPKNTLPYLKYIADPGYTHLYAIDGRTAIFDASIGYTGDGTCVRATYDSCDKLKNSSVVDGSNNLSSAKNTWRTVVIGGMGLGGATAKTCGAGTNCVATPIADPADSSVGLGYSSYFAMDVTNPMTPSLLWEYSNPALGYSTSGPAIIRVGGPNKNGKWYAVFGSGPTGPINKATSQFLGNSDQNLKFFVVDLQNGTEAGVIDTGIVNAFAGAMLGSSIDIDRNSPAVSGNYQDDAIYVGYTNLDTSVTPNTWTKGGVGRIITKESATVSDWAWSKVIDGIGPVTTSISRLQDGKNRNLWLFFGTGRYFFRDSEKMDDREGMRSLYGIKEPCFNTITTPGNYLDKTCTTTISSSVVDQTSSISTLSSASTGWKITLDAATAAEGAERVVTDTVALTNGTVFFTSFKPTLDLCGYGGNSFLWAAKYDTGGQAAANALTGKALIQLSTGEFKEVDLAVAFTDKLNRRMATPMTGKPPSDAPPIISSSQNKPVKKILHIQEK